MPDQPTPRRLGVILAGGRSTRMGGGDKCLSLLGDRPLLVHVAERLAAQLDKGRDALRLNANGDPERFAAFDLPVTSDPTWREDTRFSGPLAGVLAGLELAAEEGATEIVTVAADAPFFPDDLVARLAEACASSGAPIALAATRDEDGVLWPHPTFGLWSAALAADLRDALIERGLRKVLDWTARHDATLVEFPVGEVDPFFNINTPENLQEANALFAGTPVPSDKEAPDEAAS